MELKIKTDPKLFHHYIIAVAVHPATAGKMAGKMFLKYRPIHFTNDEVEKLQYAAMLSIDKLFKTTNSEAIESVDCQDLVYSLSAMKMGAAANQCTLHHFSSEFEMDDEDLGTIVNAANTSDYFKDKLIKSSIRG